MSASYHVARCFSVSPCSLALRVPRQRLSRNVSIELSQCVAKPSPSSLKNVYLYSNLVCVMFSGRPPCGYIVNINIVIISADSTHILICGTVYDNVFDYISESS